MKNLAPVHFSMYFLHSFLLSLLTFSVIFDRLSYSKYLFKYVILYIVFKLYLIIKYIIIKYIIIFNFLIKQIVKRLI
jgi:hypothetical protein